MARAELIYECCLLIDTRFQLDIIVGSVKLEDQFEWDLDNADASPERFALVYTKELGLGGEFKYVFCFFIRLQANVI